MVQPPTRLFVLTVASLSVFVFALAWGRGAQRRPEQQKPPGTAVADTLRRQPEVSRSGSRTAMPTGAGARGQQGAGSPAPEERDRPDRSASDPEGVIYLVQAGDTLSGIAALFRTEISEIQAANGLTSDTIRAGQSLRIPGAEPLRRHRVVAGDTLWELASRYDVGLEALLRANRGLDNPGHLQIGQELIIPPKGSRVATAVSGQVVTPVASLRGLFAWPNDAPISSRFGPRWGRNHAGIDLAANHGEPIRAARGGQVLLAGTVPGYGLTVVIQHPDGTRTLYAHASKLLVRAGQPVRQGEVIARVGSTGRSTGPHLHFEIIVNDKPHDPLLYLPPR